MARLNDSKRYYTGDNVARNIPLIDDDRYDDIEQKRKKARNLRKAHRRSKFFMVGMIAITAMLFVFCVQFLYFRNISFKKAASIAKLQLELNSLTLKNNEMEDDINTKINYNSIYDKAKNEYGMKYPKQDQIRSYKIEDSGYLKQYRNIR